MAPRKPKKKLSPSHDIKLAGSFSFTHARYIIGLDEVGRGCLAGPVFAGGFLYDLQKQETIVKGVKGVRVFDSKGLIPEERAATESALLKITEGCHHTIEQSSVEEIDEINIHNACLFAMHRAFEFLVEKASLQPSDPLLVLIDGSFVPKQISMREEIRLGHWKVGNLTKGDSRSFAIAAAAVLAKEARDRFMRKLAPLYPVYLWEQNVGYSTPGHKQALYAHGETSWHRKTFNWRKIEATEEVELES